MPLLAHQEHEERPWGAFDRYTLNDVSTVKIITVKPEQQLSLQEHQHRAEFWHILSGSGSVHIGEEDKPASPGLNFDIPQGVPHRITAGTEGISFLEIALGTFSETDETRLADDYGRGSPE